ncbi:MAG: hypothetical protein KC553_03605 [Nitrospina sp.]|nr:hypothetical protein [Nitrospina sp.]
MIKRIALLHALSALLLFGAGGLCLSSAAQGENAPGKVTVDAAISIKEITVGDLVTYTLTVTHEPGIRILAPDTPGEFPGLDLVDQGTSPERQRDGKTVEEFWFRLRGDRVGLHTLPAPPIRYEDPSGATEQTGSGQVQPPEITLSIRSVLYRDGEPTNIRDLKPIVGAAWPWKQYVLPTLAFIGLASLIGYLASRWVKRNRIEPTVPVPPPVDADELALRELERLFEKGYHLRGQIRELYFEFSEIFRRYLGERYHIPALDWTTQEIESALSRHRDPAPEKREEALRILSESDLVKFARFEVEADEAVRLMKTARAFIQTTSRTKNTGSAETATAQHAEAG